MSRKKTTNENTTAIAKTDTKITANSKGAIDETALFERIAAIIENRKARAGVFANREVTLMYWEIGRHIGSVLLDGERASYGQRIVAKLSHQLREKYGNSFERSKLNRMIKFVRLFPDFEIVAKLSHHLSWSHFVEIIPLKDEAARAYYANDVLERRYGVVELRRQISRKAYERREIANTELSEQSAIPFNVFKDPYLLDVLGLKENFLEADLERAILAELETFILEFGNGFAFVDRQKRMSIEGDDIVLDLLFYNRVLTRLVAVELKIDRFKAAYKGQMELYLKWLDENERKPNEEPPIGIILCATANRKKVEMLEMDKAGIAVAEYWTALPPKALFEEKIRASLRKRKNVWNAASNYQQELLRNRLIISMNQKAMRMNSTTAKHMTNAWEQRKLGEVAEILAGGDINNDKLSDKGAYPVIANALTNDGIVGYYEDEYRIKAPAVTVTGRGDVGHAKARNLDFTPVVRLLSVKSNHDVYFLENAINIHRVIIESTGVPQLTAPQLSNYKIWFASLEEQTQIGAFFAALDRLITLHQREFVKHFKIQRKPCLKRCSCRRKWEKWCLAKNPNLKTRSSLSYLIKGGNIRF